MKQKRLLSLVMTLVLLCSMVAGTQNVWAATDRDLSIGKINGSEAEIEGILPHGSIDSALTGAKGEVQVIVELADTPSSVIYSQLQSNKANAEGIQSTEAITEAVLVQNDRIESIQKNLVTRMTSSEISAEVIYRVKKVYNGIAISVDAEKLELIKDLPGVLAVHKLIPKYIDNSTSVPFIGGQEAWAKLREAYPTVGSGEGITIGVIDTGIDYMHSDFGGPGTYVTDVYGKPSGDSEYFGSGNKVAGGYDFAGADYDGSNEPMPDADPMPDYHVLINDSAHGTHVAATIAGFGVEADGSTYTGPYDSTLPTDLQIGPGVAPEASLYALKVFGLQGSTNLVVPALEWAMDPDGDGEFDDHLDVVNMSLGSNYGSVYDADCIAVEKAVEAGIIVVASAGNSGDAFYITGSPASSNSAISVASTMSGMFSGMDGFGIGTQSDVVSAVYGASNSVTYNWSSLTPFSAPLYYPSENQSGNSSFSASEKSKIKDKVVLLDWTTNGSSVIKVSNAYNAGAVGVIIAHNKLVRDINITGINTIPAVITNMSTGSDLKQRLSVSEAVYASFDNAYTGNTIEINSYAEDVIAGYSSMGPRSGDSMLKPDIAAPGVNIYSAEAFSGNGGMNLSGTSMAAPSVSGCMALLRQLHPDWSVIELKALIMNTATHDVKSYPVDSSVTVMTQTSKAGVGRVDVASAVYCNEIAYNSDIPELVNVSFGPLEITQNNETFDKYITVENKGNTPVEYDLSFTDIDTVPGVEFSFPDGDIVSVAANSTSEFKVRISADASQMQHTHNAGLSEAEYRSWLSESTGYITFTPTGAGEELRLSVYAAPRAASVMNSTQGQINGLVSGTTQISLDGTSVDTAGTYGETSKVSILELKESSPRIEGIQENFYQADIKYTGIMSDYKVSGITDTYLYFGISTWKDWSSPNSIEHDIYIDTNNDDVFDYVLFNDNFGRLFGGDPSDVFISTLFKINNDNTYSYVGAYYRDYNTPQYNTNLMVLPIAIDALGITDGNTKIKYQVVSFCGSSNVDTGELVSYDFANPGIYSDSTDTPYMTDETGSISLNYNRETFETDSSLGILLMHHSNESGNRDEVVDVKLVLDSNASVTPGTASFDKAAQADIPITLTANGRALTKISNQTNVLIPGTDYTVAGDIYTIKSNYLASLSNGEVILTFEMDGGVNPTTVITVSGMVLGNASVTPVTASFDKAAQADIPITLTANGRTLAKISNLTYDLVPDTDYTVSGNIYTIKSTYLALLANGEATFTFVMNGGVNPISVITVSGMIPGDAAVTPLTASFSKAAQADIPITLTANGRTLTKISNLSYDLVPGTDYAVSGAIYTIKSSYLKALSNGEVTLIFDMNGGVDPTSVITVHGTVPDDSHSSSGGGSGSGNTGSTVIKTETDANGNVTASATTGQIISAMNKAINEAKKLGAGTSGIVELNVSAPLDAKSVELSISKNALSSVVNNKMDGLTFTSPLASITFDSNALSTVSKEAMEDVKITVSKVDAATLSEGTKQIVGDRPVFNFSVKSGDKTISQFGGNVEVAVPYTPKAGEDINAIVIYYINAEGNLEIVSNCIYDPATGMITFNTNHFSMYVIGYNKVNYEDVSENAWYDKAVGFLAARGITTGTGNNNYSPEEKLTRGQFLVMVMKAYGIKPDESSKDNFADAGNNYYTGYLAEAKRLSISKGVGNNMFTPDKEISRQEMFTLLYNTLKEIGELPTTIMGDEQTRFTDEDQIASWAKDAMLLFVKTGTINGNNGMLDPTGTTNRAQMAQVLFNLLSK